MIVQVRRNISEFWDFVLNNLCGKKLLWSKVCFVIDLHPFHYIDYFEVPDHNEIQNRSAGIL